ncbi:glycosyltransferase, partial [Glaesserella parasuis]
MVLNVGIIIFIVSILVLLYCLIVKILGRAVNGWTFIVCSIWLVAGIQMLSIGIIGEYIGKIYSETKARPRFIISENLEENNVK